MRTWAAAGRPASIESAYRDIRSAIVEGRFAPGQRSVATAVAQATEVSRIPVMQALLRLEAAGFVRITPHKDVAVTGLSRAEFRERFLLMAAPQGLCVRESAGKIMPTLRARLHALQKEMAAARAQQDAARAVQVDSEFHRMRTMQRLQRTR
jgi:DNA-binding GntR family transcriptional regulator